MEWRRNLPFCLVEGFEGALHGSLRSLIALRSTFADELRILLFSLFPAFEEKRGESVTTPRLPAPLLGLWKSASGSPFVNGSVTQAETLGDLLWLEALLVQLFAFLIASEHRSRI